MASSKPKKQWELDYEAKWNAWNNAGGEASGVPMPPPPTLVQSYDAKGQSTGWRPLAPGETAESHAGDFAKAQAAQKAALEKSKKRWKTADKLAYAAAAIPFAAAAAPALIGGAAPTASVPGVVPGAVPVVGAGAGSSLTAVPTVVGATGAGTTAAATAGTAGTLAATAGPITGGGYAATVPTVTSAGGGGMGIPWYDIGKEAVKGGFDYAGSRSAGKANERASDVAAKAAADSLAFEREKEATRKSEYDTAEAAKKRNFEIEQEAKLEDLRRLEEREKQLEPARIAKESAYRYYMQKYYGIEVAPSVARTARQIATDVAAGKILNDPNELMPKAKAEAQPLAAQAAPGAGYGAPAIKTEQFTGQPQSAAFPQVAAPPPAAQLPTNPEDEEMANQGTPFRYRRQRRPMAEQEYV